MPATRKAATGCATRPRRAYPLARRASSPFMKCSKTRFEAVCGLPLVWVPWWAALKHVSANPGGPNDRDADHKGPRGILLAPGARGKLESPRRYVSLLRKDPIINLSPAE